MNIVDVELDGAQLRVYRLLASHPARRAVLEELSERETVL